MYVHRSIVDDFTDALVEVVRSLHTGDPLDDDTDVSSLISAEETERVQGWIGEATGGRRQGGDRRVRRGHRARADGAHRRRAGHGGVPERGVRSARRHRRVRRPDDAIARANDTAYGLQAAIFTADLGAALRAAYEIDFGGVLVNEVPTFRTDQMPYGGVRDSGNTKEGPHYAVREMTRERLVVIQP